MILILVVIVVSSTGYLSFYVIKPEYQASVTLLVETPQVNNQIGYDQIRANQILLKTYEEIIKSRKITEDVINTLNLNMSPEKFLQKISVKSPSDSLITSITVTDEQAEEAVLIAENLAQSFSSNLGSIMKVSNVSVLDQATLDTEKPIRPMPYLNMTIAFILSFILGCGITLLIDLFDQTIKEQSQIEEILNLPVLGVIPEIKMKIPRRMREQNYVLQERVLISEEKGDSNQVNMPS